MQNFSITAFAGAISNAVYKVLKNGVAGDAVSESDSDSDCGDSFQDATSEERREQQAERDRLSL